jgi:hypothetical protein
MQLEGKFELPQLLRLGREDLEFVTAFVQSSGSVKEMCRLHGQSYPTIRNRLNDIIERLSRDGHDLERKRREVLDEVAQGILSVKDAAKKLKELDS